MRFRLAAAVPVLLGALISAAPANAQVIMTLNNITTEGMAHAECMSRAAATIDRAGFLYHDTTSEAVWGRTHDGRFMVAIYCLTTRDVAVFAVAGPHGEGTSSNNRRLTTAWRQTR